ncbi:hypothetical protein RJZ56_001350 [Blastomyces dermatitidis]
MSGWKIPAIYLDTLVVRRNFGEWPSVLLPGGPDDGKVRKQWRRGSKSSDHNFQEFLQEDDELEAAIAAVSPSQAATPGKSRLW